MEMADNKGGLTDAVVRSLKAEPGERLVRKDDGRGGERGLEIRVTDKGVKTWNVRYYRPSDGERVRIKLGTFPAMSLEDARKECRAVRVSLDRNEDPSIDREKRKGADTFRNWPKSIWRSTPRTSVPERRRGAFWRESGSRHRCHEGRRSGTAYHYQGAGGYSSCAGGPRCGQSGAGGDRGVYNWAVETGRLERTPVVKVKRKGEEEPRTRFLNLHEIRTLWTALASLPISDEVKDIVRLCLITGQRVGEVAGLRRSELNLDTSMWLLPKDRTKNGLPHLVPLTDAALAIITPRMKGRGQLLFPGRASGAAPVLSSAPNKALQRHMDRIGIPPFTVHDLRRTVNTHMARLGIDAQARSRILNHVSGRKASVTEAVYNSHSYDLEKRAALETWAREFTSIVSIPADNIISMRTA